MFQVSEITEDEDKETLVKMLRKPVLDEYSIFRYEAVYINFGVKKPGTQFTGSHHVDLDEEDISYALGYLFKKGTIEVKKFNKSDFLQKIAIEKNGFLFSKNRLLESQRFKAAGGLEEYEMIEELGIKSMTPVLDRFSPLSYSIGDYIHRIVAKHQKC